MNPRSDDPIEEPESGRDGEEPMVSDNDQDSNDQGSHVSPSDNDGETIPQDEVVDQAFGA
jgi:hypothetical protein